MAGHKTVLGKGWKIKDGKPVKTGRGKNVAQKIAERKSKRVRVVKAIATVIAVCIVAPQVQAKTVRICNVWDHCWFEDDGKPTARRTYRKRKPEVRAYVKREREHEDDGIRCKETLTVIGDARPSEQGAREDAESVFMRASRYRHGESWMDPKNARDYAIRCARASITEIVGQVMVRCELRAKPCRPPFQSK